MAAAPYRRGGCCPGCGRSRRWWLGTAASRMGRPTGLTRRAAVKPLRSQNRPARPRWKRMEPIILFSMPVMAWGNLAFFCSTVRGEAGAHGAC